MQSMPSWILKYPMITVDIDVRRKIMTQGPSVFSKRGAECIGYSGLQMKMRRSKRAEWSLSRSLKGQLLNKSGTSRKNNKEQQKSQLLIQKGCYSWLGWYPQRKVGVLFRHEETLFNRSKSRVYSEGSSRASRETGTRYEAGKVLGLELASQPMSKNYKVGSMVGSDRPPKSSMGYISLCFQKQLKVLRSVSPGFKEVAKDMLDVWRRSVLSQLSQEGSKPLQGSEQENGALFWARTIS